jgi:catechol 2,3-dioxygenase-like lactoylglutathione lyase family enzyme
MAEALGYRFDHVHVYCSDLAASEQWFVEGLGAQLVRRGEAAGAKQAVLNLAGVSLLLRAAREGEELGQAGGPRFGADHIGLAVDDLDATAAELKRRGVKFSLEPVQFAPGLRISFVTGPDNVRVEIVERKG